MSQSSQQDSRQFTDRVIDLAYVGPYTHFNLRDIDRRAIHDRIVRAVTEHGYFPPTALVTSTDPPIYIGPQIRKVNDGKFIVANVEWKQYGTFDEPSRIFADLSLAVRQFIQGTIEGYPCSPYEPW